MPGSQRKRSDECATLASTTATLVAVRRAGGALLGEWNPRSHLAAQAFNTIEHISLRLAALADSLSRSLHSAVQAADSRHQRHRLLKLKRNIFNLRPLPHFLLEGIDAGLAAALTSYGAILQERNRLAEQDSGAFVDEIRGRLRELKALPLIRCCLDYAAPRVLPVLETESPPEREFSDAEITFYSYLARFFSKANPYHAFSAIALPDNTEAGEACEVTLDIACLRKLEQTVLRTRSDASRTFVRLCSRLRAPDGVVHFLTQSGGVWRRVAVRQSAALDRVMEFFENPDRERTLDALAGHLSAAPAGLVLRQAEALIEQLAAAGILITYLIRNERSFAADLLGYGAAVDEFVAHLQQFHLHALPLADLPGVHESIRNIEMLDAPQERVGYFVNRFLSVDFPCRQGRVELLADDLATLKPLLTATSNFSARSAALSRFVQDRLAASGRRAVPLLEIAFDLMGETRLATENAPAPEAMPGRPDALEGSLSETQIERLLRLLPPEGRRTHSLCVNGVFDSASELFYLSNLLPGNQRYQCRYRLSQPFEGRAAADAQGVEPVQLIAPLGRNRDYVPVMLATGCSFDGSFRPRFERWIDPSDLLVGASGGEVIFLRRADGRRVEFFHHGMLLGEQLPAPYQLLLIGKPDFFWNPFAAAHGAAGLDPNGGFSFRPGAAFRRICLRRDRWIAPVKFLRPAAGNRDTWRFCVELRTKVRSETGRNSDHWYYALPRAGRNYLKPAYLDLANPLSAAVFHRRLNGCRKDDQICFTEMRPAPAELDEGHVAEWMIEV